MKYFKNIKWTVGSRLIGGEITPTASDKLLDEIDTAKRMLSDSKISALFSPISRKEVPITNHLLRKKVI